MQGRGWRLILETRFTIEQITNGLDALEHAGRYNPPPLMIGEGNAFKVVYLSGSPRTAHQEVQGRADIRNHTLVEFEYVLQEDAWLDLTNEAIRRQFEVTLSDLYEDWRYLNAYSQLSTTQRIGIRAYSDSRVEALKVPSAQDDTGFNWVIFPDRLYLSSYVKPISFQASNGEDTGKESTASSFNETDSEDERNNSLSEQKSIAEELMGDSQF